MSYNDNFIKIRGDKRQSLVILLLFCHEVTLPNCKSFVNWLKPITNQDKSYLNGYKAVTYQD